jgi:hypothetical protein
VQTFNFLKALACSMLISASGDMLSTATNSRYLLISEQFLLLTWL